MRIYTDKRTVGIKCSIEELQGIVESVIENKMSDLFSFRQLSDRMCVVLNEKDMLNKEPDTRYEGGYELSSLDIDLVQKIVWGMIWDRKLMLDLYNDEYRYTSDRTSARLIKVK